MASAEQAIETVDAEVFAVKAAYPGGCRVIKDSGHFSHVITVQPADMDATIKFQVPAQYPQEQPVIAIRSSSLSSDVISEVMQKVTGAAHSWIGQAMLQKLIDETTRHLVAAGLRPGKTLKVSQETDLCAKKKKVKKPKKKPGDRGEDEDDAKLPPMKTASDVINRVIWDEALEKDDFIVGYIDRFRGLMERCFSAFSWEDLASVDYDVLAVPRHRIQYFKYKDVKVWDKPRRLDNVFGSAKGTKTIDVVVKELEEANRQDDRVEGAAGVVRNSHKAIGDPDKSDCSLSDSFDDSDDDDEDDVIVTIGPGAGIGLGRGVNNSTPGRSDNATEPRGIDNGNKELEERLGAGEYNPYWRDKLRPNYFVCVRITDPVIMDQAVHVQDYIMEQEPLLAECCIPGASLHVTLCCLGLDTAQQLQMCVDALSKVKDELRAALPPRPLHLRGVSNFYNRVVYAKVNHGADFLKFCDLLKTLLREAGVQIRDGYEFVPHATLLKVSRPVARERGSKNLSGSLYAPFSDIEFGSQRVDSIALCSMDKARRSDGFYLTPLELNFSS